MIKEEIEKWAEQIEESIKIYGALSINEVDYTCKSCGDILTFDYFLEEIEECECCIRDQKINEILNDNK